MCISPLPRTRTEENVRRIVGNYEGYLQSDAYICYELIAAASNRRIIPVGCWAHARRKYEPLIEAGPHPQATWILGQIQKLYDIEDRARDMTDRQRLALRQAESRPIVNGIRDWLESGSGLGKGRGFGLGVGRASPSAVSFENAHIWYVSFSVYLQHLPSLGDNFFRRD